MNPWLGIVTVFATLLALLGGLRWAQGYFAWHPELPRKLAHVGMGLVTLTVPRLFEKPWPVFVLCGLAVGLLAAVRWWAPLRTRLGGVLGGVGRGGLGELYFAVAVALVFWLSRNTNFSRGTNLLFVIPVLILTLADATGALVGVRYGRARYATDDGYKSAEGSLAFFLAAFASTHVPLLLCSDTGRAESLLIGLTLGFLVMLLEAVSWRGLDNLFVPLASFVALRIYLHLSVPALAWRLAALAGLVVFMRMWRQTTLLSDGALVAGALVLYFCASLGGWPWLLGPLALLAGYALLCPEALTRRQAGAALTHNVEAVAGVSAAGLAWLFAAKGAAAGYGDHQGEETWLWPFTLTFAAHLGMVALAHLREANRRPAGIRTVAEAWGIAVGIVLVPFCLVLFARGDGVPVGYLVLGALAVAGAVAAFDRWQERMDDCPTDTPRWVRQGTLAALASLAGIGSVGG